jgi:hypothetical protein
MSGQLHNLGFLRKAVEDAIVSLLQNNVGTVASIRPAFTTTAKENPLVTVHATETRERDEDSYTLNRYLDVEIRCITYAQSTALLTAREAHFELVAAVYHTMAQADIVTQLNALLTPRVAFWSCYAKTDAGGSAGGAYVSTIAVEIGATPQPD